MTGGIQKQAKRRPVKNKFPFLRVANVGRGRLDLGDVHEVELFEGELERFRLKCGDLLVVEGNGSPDQVGRAATWHGAIKDAVHQNHLIKVRPTSAIDPKFLELLWNSPDIASQLLRVAQSTSGLYTLSTSKLNRVEFALPPLAEQRRIVEALEEQLSRLDSGIATLRLARRRLDGLRKRILVSSVPDELPASWEMATVEEAGTLELGRARHPDWHHGPDMRPYLRVANVFEDRIDTSDVMEMDFFGVWERYRLEPGDVLLNEGQSPHLVGRPAIYRGVPAEVAFTNSLLRFKAGDGVLPEWALLVFRRHLHAKRFMREVRITTNIAHLSAKRLKTVEFPIPPVEVQEQLVQRCEELLSGVAAMEQVVSNGVRRANALRAALLNRAFHGGLVAQPTDDEPASMLLARIAAERAAQPKARRSRKATVEKLAKAPAPRAAPPELLAPEPTAAPALAVQQEFDL
ncbi:restriction endonuclease subunit S [Streptomyces sp. NBC_01483]|uniref:restriction endonuclease subunit S n=1 Tax=Streptomyces sp. NBC_01483 TaxID=2903883 RepID=UPI002E30BF16|nr:restriction endonuclease subunit S [Streptomyces sp. NBC_01483]